MDFAENIKKWVSSDNRIKKMQEDVKIERENRNQLAQAILYQVQDNNMAHSIIQITDGNLKFQNRKVTSSLTYKFLETCLNDCIANEEQVNQIIKYIKSKREVTEIADIKRSYN